jgi:hypothetical protein
MNRRTFLRLAGAGIAGLPLTQKLGSSAMGQSGPVAGRQAVVTTESLNVRGGPGSGEPVVGRLSEGAVVDVLAGDGSGGWWRVATATEVGWVSGGYLSLLESPVQSQIFDVDLVFPFARQLTNVWCEAADIEMWMAHHGQASDIPNYARQQRIWDWELANNAGFTVDQWNCSPFAAASAAHFQMPDLGFEHCRYDDPMAGSRMLAWQLAHPEQREPAIALIWRGGHYVLVRGVRAIGDPGQDPAGAEILGFYIADPNQADRRWYGSDRFIPLSQWLGELFLPASYLTPHTGVPGDVWQGAHVTVQRTSDVAGPTQSGRANPTPAPL